MFSEKHQTKEKVCRLWNP